MIELRTTQQQKHNNKITLMIRKTGNIFSILGLCFIDMQKKNEENHLCKMLLL